MRKHNLTLALGRRFGILPLNFLDVFFQLRHGKHPLKFYVSQTAPPVKAKAAGDALANAAIPGAGIYMLGTRTFGDASRQAREDGADIGGQILYGAGRTLTATQIEKWFDGVSGIYGKSQTKEWAKKFVEKFNNGTALRKLAQATANDAGELREYVATVLADSMLQPLYKGKEGELDTEWGQVGRNALIDIILNIITGDSAFGEP